MSYTTTTARASAPESPTPSDQHRAAFARDAVFAEFRPGDARALDHDSFTDRRPDQGPRPLGEVAAQVVNDTGEKALRHWLAQAAGADNEQDRSVALEIAHEIARLAGIDLAEKEAA